LWPSGPLAGPDSISNTYSPWLLVAFWDRSDYAAQASLEFRILLPQLR
jgi:hypothetical protein